MVVQGLPAAWAFSSCGEQGLLFSGGPWASHSGGSSCCRARVLEPIDLSTAAPGLQSPGPGAVIRGHSCFATWGLPRPGVELESTALAGERFFTTEPPGKPSGVF